MESKSLSEEEEKELLNRIQDGDSAAMETLTVQYMEYIRGICNRVITEYFLDNNRDVAEIERIRKESIDDLMQAGSIGFMSAAEKYDLEMNARFSTYAYKYIYWPAQNELIRLMDRLGLGGMKGKKTRRQAVSLDMPENGLTDMLASEEDILRDLIESEEERERSGKIAKMFSQLTDDEKKVLYRFYGIEGMEEHSLRTIGKEFGLSELKIRTIYETAMKKLRTGE